MLDEAILTRWIEQRSTIALQKLLHNEPLTFEDNVIFGLVGQREELHRLEQRLNERFEQVNKRFELQDQRISERFELQDQRISERFELQDQRFKQQEKRFERVERQLERMEDSIEYLCRELNDTRREILVYTRWTLTAIIAVPVVTKIVEALLAKLP